MLRRHTVLSKAGHGTMAHWAAGFLSHLVVSVFVAVLLAVSRAGSDLSCMIGDGPTFFCLWSPPFSSPSPVVVEELVG